MDWNATNIPDQRGKVALVTGVGGLGFETGVALVRAGASLILAGRNPEKGQASVDRLRRTVPSADVQFVMVDLASLSSIEGCAARLSDEQNRIDLLINNAGVMNIPERRETEDGFELQFGTNHLGHYALTARLMPLLLKSAVPRVVSLSSNFHRQGTINFDDLHAKRHYNPTCQYAQSKLATLMFALELDRRARSAGAFLVSNAAHPGFARTDLVANGPGDKGLTAIISHLLGPIMGQTAAGGALSTLYAATAPEAAGGGKYYGPTKFLQMKGPPGEATIAKQAEDMNIAKRLWAISAEMTDVEPSFA